MARVYRVVLAWVITLLGGFFAVAGGVLASISGSPYYLIVGIAMVASGALLGRGSPLGRQCVVITAGGHGALGTR